MLPASCDHQCHHQEEENRATFGHLQQRPGRLRRRLPAHLIGLQMIRRVAPLAARTALRPPARAVQQVHQPPGGGGYVSDVLGGCWRLGAPGSGMVG